MCVCVYLCFNWFVRVSQDKGNLAYIKRFFLSRNQRY